MQVEVDILELVAHIQPLNLQNGFRTDVGGHKVVVLDVTAGQIVGELLLGQVRGQTGVDILAVTHDAHVVGNLKDFIRLVGDEHDGDAGITKLTDSDEQGVNLFLGQRGGRLVHDDELGVEQQGTADGNQLLVGHTQFAHFGIQINVAADLGQGFPGGGIPALAIDQLGTGGNLRVDGQVLTDSQVGENGQILIDDLNTQTGGFGGGNLRDGLSLKDYFAFVSGIDTGNNLDKGRLAAAVFTGQAHNFSGTYSEVYVIQCVNTGKGLADSGHLKQIFFRHGKLLLLLMGC